MVLEYKFTMSPEDQERFINIERSSKYGELLRNIKQSLDPKEQSINFKEQSSSKFVLARLDQKIMKETIGSFPVDLALNDKSIYQFTKAQLALQTSPDKVYDVRFIIPLLYHAVSPSLFVDCRDFIARRCLALTLTGLSSEDFQMRALCYKILERYYEHLLSALLIDKQLWINFLDLIRNSIPNPNCRLKFIFTTFLAKIIDVLLHPENDKMYELVKEFLAGRPRLRIDTIEIYDDLLLCSDVDYYNNNLRWLITLFRDGVQCKNDLKVLVNLNVIPQAMCLYNSELRFERANETICSMLIRISSVESGAHLLVSDYSFLPWLHQVILYHLNQSPEEIKNDTKGESLGDTARSISSLVFSLIDVLLKDREHPMSLPRLLELINVFIVLHDLVIKSKSASVLGYYLNYVRKVAKAIRKDPEIPDKLSGHLLELIKAKMPYLA